MAPRTHDCQGRCLSLCKSLHLSSVQARHSRETKARSRAPTLPPVSLAFSVSKRLSRLGSPSKRKYRQLFRQQSCSSLNAVSRATQSFIWTVGNRFAVSDWSALCESLRQRSDYPRHQPIHIRAAAFRLRYAPFTPNDRPVASRRRRHRGGLAPGFGSCPSDTIMIRGETR